MRISQARKIIRELLVQLWTQAGSFDNVDAYTRGYIEALEAVLKQIGGAPIIIRKCLEESCDNIIAQSGSGRKRLYCLDSCRAKAYRLRKSSG